VIETKGLSRRFGEVVAVESLDLSVGEGEIFGFLGPNGAGKTTTIRMLGGLIRPSGGWARVAGHELGREDEAIRREVGILTESPGLYDRLSAERNLAFFAELYEVEDVVGQVERYLRAARSSSAPTTWTRPIGCVTASRSSTTACWRSIRRPGCGSACMAVG